MDGHRITGAISGALFAGLALSAVMLAGAKLTGKPSELIELERKSAGKLGIAVPTGDAPAGFGEQVLTHCQSQRR